MSAKVETPTDDEAPKVEKAGAGKKKLFIGLGALLLLGGGGGGYFFMTKGADKEAQHEAAPPAEEGEQIYVDVPEMVVNLRAVDARQRFLKIHFMLVASDPKAEEAITAKIPAIKDSLQSFLRELRPEDLAGSAAVYRVKEEIFRRASAELEPGQVKDVLIQDMIQQ